MNAIEILAGRYQVSERLGRDEQSDGKNRLPRAIRIIYKTIIDEEWLHVNYAEYHYLYRLN